MLSSLFTKLLGTIDRQYLIIVCSCYLLHQREFVSSQIDMWSTLFWPVDFDAGG